MSDTMEGGTVDDEPTLTRKRRREDTGEDDDDESDDKKEIDVEALFAAVPSVLAPPNDPSFTDQSDYLYSLLSSCRYHSLSSSDNDASKQQLAKKLLSSWKSLAGEISSFISFYLIRKTYEDDPEELRSAVKAMHNLTLHCQHTNLFVNDDKEDDDEWLNVDNLLEYTKSMAEYPFEVIVELQKLWDTFYWEKKEEVYPHLKKSKFTLEPGDYYTNKKGEEVMIDDSDMIMTNGDINKQGGAVRINLAVARVTTWLVRDRGFGGSRGKFKVRGQRVRIFTGPDTQRDKQLAYGILARYRAGDREYEELQVDDFCEYTEVSHITIQKVCKDGWYMAPKGGGSKGVFVPLTAKVAKMGRVGTVFSGMRLALAGGVWRPIPNSEYKNYICYNVYPPDIFDYEKAKQKKGQK